jgi:translation elongation factor EF-1alpha
MDQVHVSEERFQEVAADIEKDLQQYNTQGKTPIVPVSAFSPGGEGIIRNTGGQTNKMSWYQGQNLLELLQEAETKEAYSADAPLRLAVEGRGEIFSPPGAGTVLVGTLEAGTLTPGQEIVAEPARTLGKPNTGRIRDVFLAKSVTDTTPQRMQEVRERSIVSVSIPNWERKEANQYLRHGGVLGTKDSPPSVANTIEAEVVFFEEDLVYFGKKYVIQPHVSYVTGSFREILDKEVLDLKEDDFAAPVGQRVRAVIEFDEPWCIETVEDFPRLSRFAVMEQNRTVAYGTCIRILDFEKLYPELLIGQARGT